jgi:alanine racemase
MRAAGNERFDVLINGKKAKIIGNICMDMFMVDLTDLAFVKAGDEVILFGQENPIEELAKVCHTIPYEILTRISNRIKRIYVHTNV